MRARVIELNDQQIYLEVEKQLRFKSSYRARNGVPIPTVADLVEFEFDETEGHSAIIIKSVSPDHLVHRTLS